MIAYLVKIKPYKKKLENKLTIFNEVTLLLTAISMIMIKDNQTPSKQTKKAVIGYFLITIIIANLAINFLIMIYQPLKHLYDIYNIYIY